MFRTTMQAFCVLVIATNSAVAQREASDSVRIEAGTQLWPGPFIRAYRMDGSMRAGRLARVTMDTLAIRDAAGRPVTEPRSLVRRVEVRDRQRLRGAGRGALIGSAAAVVVVGAGAIVDRHSDGEGWILMGALGLGLPLPAIGSAVGFIFAPTRWRPAYVR